MHLSLTADCLLVGDPLPIIDEDLTAESLYVCRATIFRQTFLCEAIFKAK